jgi:hypothetical protein
MCPTTLFQLATRSIRGGKSFSPSPWFVGHTKLTQQAYEGHGRRWNEARALQTETDTRYRNYKESARKEYLTT